MIRRITRWSDRPFRSSDYPSFGCSSAESNSISRTSSFYLTAVHTSTSSHAGHTLPLLRSAFDTPTTDAPASNCKTSRHVQWSITPPPPALHQYLSDKSIRFSVCRTNFHTVHCPSNFPFGLCFDSFPQDSIRPETFPTWTVRREALCRCTSLTFV